jgi:hypothetical protein
MSEGVPAELGLEAYADAFLVKWSAYGFDLTLGTEFLPGYGLKSAAATVHMSPQLALLLARTLTEQVEAYEHQVGPIPAQEASAADVEDDRHEGQ